MPAVAGVGGGGRGMPPGECRGGLGAGLDQTPCPAMSICSTVAAS